MTDDTPVRTLRLTVEYDGTAYCGWQIQPNGPTIQAELEEAWWKLTGERIRVRGAGRTDTGVHARGQVAAFRTTTAIPADSAAAALNTRLPADIAIHDAREVPLSFDPRRDCVRKRYAYTIVNGPARPAIGRNTAWHIRRPLDAEAMRRAAIHFTGTHDFAAFSRRDDDVNDTVRTVLASEIAEVALPDGAPGNRRFIYLAEGKSFLYNMVRAIAGTLVDVGHGRFAPDDVPAILASGDRARAGQSAPPGGLCLEWICYAGDADA